MPIKIGLNKLWQENNVYMDLRRQLQLFFVSLPGGHLRLDFAPPGKCVNHSVPPTSELVIISEKLH